jgi:threonine dehydrogenase-like Zn-dependent dehydrogenase
VTALTPGTRVAAWRDQGHHRPGAYARYATFLEDNLLALPSGLASERVTSLELAMCVQVSFDQLNQIGAVKGKRFGVSGLGPAGLVAVQLARALGAREVVALDPLPARRELARSLGASVVLDPTGDDLPPGRGAATALDAALDCTGLKASIEYLMDRTRQAVAIFGVLREIVGFGPGHWPGLALMGYLAHNRSAAERALAQIVAGRLDLACLSTHALPLSRYAEGVELLRRKEAIKVRFLPWGE